jgi:abortive infection bacteriophage resistance protein
MRFSKPALPIADQLTKLELRGLILPDRSEAEHYLRHIGYYRLSAYALPFQDSRQPAKPFHPGVSFSRILDLYRFDRELRLLILDAIERIEIALRSVVNNEMCLRHGSHWFMDPGHFSPHFNHARFIAEIESELLIKRPGGQPERPHREVFINHYYTKYGEPNLPPSWMVMEIFSFGTLSRLFASLKSGPERVAIAAPFCTDESVLRNWFHVVSYTRNLCAHHARFWNRQYVIKFQKTARRHQDFLNTTDRFYALAVVLFDLLQRVAPGTRWNENLRDLLAGHPDVPLAPMGFPTNWQTHPFWKFQTRKGVP